MRYVLLDRLLELEPGVRVLAERCFPRADEIFDDHFPGAPIVPGALLVESMGQAGGWLIAATLGFTRWPLLTMIDSAKFRTVVAPGERILIEGMLRATRGDSFEVATKATVADRRVATARLRLHAVDTEPLFGSSDFPDWARETFRALGGEDLPGVRPGTRTAS